MSISPAAVSETPRRERSSSRLPTRSSSRWTMMLTAAWVLPSASAAAVKPPQSTTAMKVASASLLRWRIEATNRFPSARIPPSRPGVDGQAGRAGALAEPPPHDDGDDDHHGEAGDRAADAEIARDLEVGAARQHAGRHQHRRLAAGDQDADQRIAPERHPQASRHDQAGEADP